MAAAASQLQLLPVRPPGAPPFVLAVECAGDRHFAPCLRHHALWEPAETLALLRMLQPGMTVVDVGAHVGYYSVLCAQRVGRAGRVIAFEPEAQNRRLLHANLLLNDCANVAVHASAVDAAAGSARLFLSDSNRGDHRLHAVAGRRSVAVDTVSLDAALAGLALDFVKIDTQGAEPRVLHGMAGLIASQRERLGMMLEFAPGLLSRAGVATDSFAAQLAALDARVYRVALQGRQVTLTRLDPLRAALALLAEELAARGEGEDASLDLFAWFSPAAEAAWLARFRG